jgi:hypothetical protein
VKGSEFQLEKEYERYPLSQNVLQTVKDVEFKVAVESQ